MAQTLGAFGSSSGGHLVVLNGMRPSDARYAALPLAGVSPASASPDYIIVVYPISDPLARRAYAQQVGNDAPVKSTDIYFSPAGSLQEGNPQLILDRHEPVKLLPVLLLQGSADANGVVKDKNVSPKFSSVLLRHIKLRAAEAGQTIGETRPFAPSSLAAGS